jgi:hypothetical protein
LVVYFLITMIATLIYIEHMQVNGVRQSSGIVPDTKQSDYMEEADC